MCLPLAGLGSFLGSSGLWVSGSPLLELFSFVVLTLSRKEVQTFLREVSALSMARNYPFLS